MAGINNRIVVSNRIMFSVNWISDRYVLTGWKVLSYILMRCLEGQTRTSWVHFVMRGRNWSRK